jgi:transcriptional regulator with XRE-family HTH domain
VSKNDKRARAIKAELVMRGLTQRAFANKIGMSETAVNRGIHGSLRTRKLDKELGRLLRSFEKRAPKHGEEPQ